MSLLAVAEKDFRDAVRSRLLIALTVLFALFAAGAAYVVTNINPPQETAVTGEVTTLLLISGLVSATAVFIPIVSIAVAYRSLSGERQSGSLKLLLSLPNSRAQVVAGKFLGRSGVVAVALLVGFAIGLVFTATFADAFAPMEYLAFVGVSLVFAFVFVAIAVGVSAFTSSTARAAYGAFGLFVVFQFLWSILVQGSVYLANGLSFEGLQQGDLLVEVSQVLQIINPATAYQQGTLWVVRLLAENQEVQTADSFYLEPWFGFVVLAVWIVLPLTIGHLRFKSADL